MIVFVPGYDEATRANVAVATRMRIDACEVLLSSEATKSELLIRLARAPVPFFAMSHGEPNRLFDHNNEAALDSHDVSFIGNRCCYVFACWTAGELGRAAAQSGATWWGYTGAVGAPDADERFVGWFADVFEMIRGRFELALTIESRRQLLEDIATRCREYMAMLDDDEGASPDAYLSLMHIWGRLRVWVPGATDAERHPNAPLPSILDENPNQSRGR